MTINFIINNLLEVNLVSKEIKFTGNKIYKINELINLVNEKY